MKTRQRDLLKRALVALLLGGLGVIEILWAQIRLGRGRGGVEGFEYLHLDWIAQTDLPYWGAHMSNLAGLAFGYLCATAAAIIILRGGLVYWRGRPGPGTGKDAEQ